mgnify:CR=1 FL=1
MAESKVKRENYIVIQGFMLTDLNLKGNELLIYACIYGFSQDGSNKFTGSLQYLADWTNSTKQGVMKNLKSLVEKGYIQKDDKIINGVKFCEYHATELNTLLNKVEQGMQQSLTPPMKQSLPNNLSLDTLEENLEDKKVKKKTKFDEIINSYSQDEIINDLLHEWLEVRKAKKVKKLIKKLYLKNLIFQLMMLQFSL